MVCLACTDPTFGFLDGIMWQWTPQSEYSRLREAANVLGPFRHLKRASHNPFRSAASSYRELDGSLVVLVIDLGTPFLVNI
jgi:hypothetical protein